MATRPSTFAMLQAVQWRIQNELTTTGVAGGPSYFDAWNPNASSANPGGVSDLMRYNTPANSGGTISNVIYIGFPKDFTPTYKVQCVIDTVDDLVQWRSNPRVFDEANLYVRCWFYMKDDWYGMKQTAIAVRDQLQVVIQSHAELPSVPEVQAVKQKPGAKGLQTGWFYDEVLGNEWYCYATTWWHRQEWTVPGGLIGA